MDASWPRDQGAGHSSGRQSCLRKWGPGCGTNIQHMKQLAHHWYLPLCQCTEKCAHVFIIQKWYHAGFNVNLCKQKWSSVKYLLLWCLNDCCKLIVLMPNLQSGVYCLPIGGFIRSQPSAYNALNNKTSHRKILRSLASARYNLMVVRSLWNLTGLAVILSRCHSNFRTIRWFKHPISWLRCFTRSDGKMSYCSKIEARGSQYKDTVLPLKEFLL